MCRYVKCNQVKKNKESILKKEKTQAFKEEKGQVKEQIEKELMDKPENQALFYLTKGEIFDRETPDNLQGLKLDRKALEDSYGESILANLPQKS